MLLRPTIRCDPKRPIHVHIPVEATRSIEDDDDNHEVWDLEPVSSGMDTGLHPGGLNEQRDARHPTLGQFLVYYDMDSVPPYSEPSLRVLVSGECAVDPYPIVVLVGRFQSPSSSRPAGETHTWMPACWMPFCISPGCSVGPVTTSAKDQIHIAVFVQREVHFTYPFLLMSFCHGTTAQYISKTTTVRWVLITVDRGIFVFPVLYVTSCDPWSSDSVINVLSPFDGYVNFLLGNSSFYIFVLFWGFLPIPIVIMPHSSHIL
jgi:hypothetical protein